MITILIADDEELERRALTHILTNAGKDDSIQMKEAINGLEALRIARAEKMDIALLDIQMPGMDGLEVAEKLSAIADPPIIIMITAYDYFTYARSALRFGVLDYLLKPASAEDVSAAFRRSLHEIDRKNEETARRSATLTIVADVEENIRAGICRDLRSGKADDNAIQRLVSLRAGVVEWSCVAMVAGVGRAPSDTPLATREFSRSFSALAERYLLMDLGLTEVNPILLISSPESGAGNTQALPTVRLLLVAPVPRVNSSTDRADERQSMVNLQRLRELVSGKIDYFYHRCKDTQGADFQIGLGIETTGNAKTALQTARIAFNLSNAEHPILFLNREQNIQNGLAPSANSLAIFAINWLQDHFMESIGIWNLAEKLQVSSSHLSRVLKREVGMGFGEALARVRIARAKNLLANGISAKEASALVGFRDQSYFTKVFMKIEGISPSQYTENM